MSYSFSVNAPDRSALKAAVSTKFDEIVAQQPIHAHDREHVQKMVADQLAMLSEPQLGECYHANVNGYLSWRAGIQETEQFTHFSAAANVFIGVAPDVAKLA